MGNKAGSWEKKVEAFLEICLSGKKHGVFIMNLEDVPALFHHLPAEELAHFQSTQESFYLSLVTLWGLRMEPEELRIFSNKMLAVLLLKNSNLFDIPAFFPGLAEKAIQQWIEDIITRLKAYRIPVI